MNEQMKQAWLEISQMLGEPTREELDVFLRTWQRATEAHRKALAEQPAQQEPVLQDIEQYRLQMAGICTAAIGYWKESDGIHPDYDTLALRDVARLYAKYDELYKAQDVSHGMIAGALFDFMGWLTCRPKRIMLSSADDASPAVDAIKDFAKMRGLSLDDAKVQDWHTTPQAQRKPLTDAEIERACVPLGAAMLSFTEVARAIEAAHGIKGEA